MIRSTFAAALLAWMALGSFGCVRASEHEAKLAELGTCQSQAQACNQQLHKTVLWAQLLGKQAADLRARLDAQTDKANKDLADLQKQFDESTALVNGLRTELQRTGADVDKLMREKGTLSASLEQTRKRLEELRKAEEAAQKRAESMRNLIDRFRKMADAGQLKVTVRRGRMVLQLPNDVLFDSGRADVKSSGQATLAEVARILGTIQDRQFQVAGHTDDRPIQTSQFPSNWYLSTSRAVRVVEYLTREGMKAQPLSACGYGEFDPIAPNDTDESRARNRRIEITIQPNVDEILSAADMPK